MTRAYIASKGSTAVDNAPLRPDFRYLRATIGSNEALIVLGYIDPVPIAGTEVWYSGTKQVVRLSQGRIVGTTGLEIDWPSVALSQVPTWREVIDNRGGQYQRRRDTMPSYVSGIRETVTIRPIAVPTDSRLVQVTPASLQWFEERSRSDGLPTDPLPAARFALDASSTLVRVVYSEQCLSPRVCISLQAWPVRR